MDADVDERTRKRQRAEEMSALDNTLLSKTDRLVKNVETLDPPKPKGVACIQCRQSKVCLREDGNFQSSKTFCLRTFSRSYL